MKLPPPFTIYDLRFTISKKSGRAAGPLTAADGAHGVTRSPLFNRKSPIVNRKWEQGIALVITLIMLAITLVMAVAFLALARRERGSVTTSTDTTTARLAAETALANAQAQIVANLLTGGGNAYNLGLLVSTNYINPAGFDNTGGPNGSSNPTNVNYDHLLNSATALSPNQLCQNISNLFFLPRAPVMANVDTNNFAGRFYLDLNRNGTNDPNGVVTNVDANNNVLIDPVTQNPVVTVQTGDPEWVGVLEHPDATHGPNNKFLSRYAFIALPVGNTLDLNYIYNQAKTEKVDPAASGADGFFRNQGVGSWELNLAAFLADLNTNIWSPVPLPANLYYAYNEPFNNNSGIAFQDALSLLSYRYNFNYDTLASAKNFFYYDPANTTYAAQNSFPYDRIDGYTDGSLQTTLNTNADYPTPDDYTQPWAGADNTNHYFAVSDLFDPNKVGGGLGSFTNRLGKAGSSVDTYDRYTYYRMLSQLGTDSAPDEGKLNLNYSNAIVQFDPSTYAVTNIAIIPGDETNLVPWLPRNFFVAAADQLLRLYSTSWYNANYQSFTNTYGVTVPFSITNIPVWVSNRFVYTPAVNRLLQLAANLYDATTTTNNNLPHVFRPIFKRINNAGDIVIASYMQVTNVIGTSDFQLVQPIDVTGLDDPNQVVTTLNTPIKGLRSGLLVNVYGVPWIIGAKKGLPAFNQLYMNNVVQVTRKLQMTRQPGVTGTPNATNQMYIFNIAANMGMSFWNSYFNNYVAKNGSLRIYAVDSMSMSMTNATGKVVWPTAGPSFANYVFSTNFTSLQWPGSQWSGTPPTTTPVPASFVCANWIYSFVPSLVYRYGLGTFDTSYSGTNLWDTSPTGNPMPLPQFGLATTNYLQAVILDGNNVIDYVQLRGPISLRNINQELNDPDYTSITRSGALMWSKNLTGGGLPWGIQNQINVSETDANLPVGDSWLNNLPGFPSGLTTNQQAIFFNDFMVNPNSTIQVPTIQAPYTPTRAVYEADLYQANDPLVHYLTSDLNYVNPGTEGLQYTDDLLQHPVPVPTQNNVGSRYQPWGAAYQKQMAALTSVDTNAFNLAYKDPLVWSSDNWDFPTNLYPTVGWIGRVHRGTPWQTVDLKSTNILLYSMNVGPVPTNVGTNTWAIWTGDTLTNLYGQYYDAANSAPMQDRLLFDIFTTRFCDNAVRGTLPVNQTHLAAWSALFSGMVALTNNNLTPSPINPPTYLSTNINPAGIDTADSQLEQIVSSINNTRAQFPLQAFTHVGDVLETPALTEQSPFLNRAGFQPKYGISDELYEWLPQQMMGLVRLGEPRYVVYCYGQALRPAPGGQVLGGPFFQLITNYQVAAESGIRAVIRIDNATTAHPHAVVESYNVLPPN